MSNRRPTNEPGAQANSMAVSAHLNLVVAGAFLIVVPIACHLLFSWMGFSPTDDGFTLAYSRRIIEGQIPHRDFIIIRPFLSPLTHVPFVLFGGEYTLWWSRLFVWFQLVCIAWLWIVIINRALNHGLKPGEKFCAALIAFMLCAHEYPIMAWHTVDGLLLSSLGLALCARPYPRHKLIGYLFLAMAYLCKQSFLFLTPAALFILNDWRQVKYWAAAFVPAALYIGFLLVAGAFDDGLLQLTSQYDLWPVGVASYLTPLTLAGLLLGGSYSLLGLPHWKLRFLRDSQMQRRLGTLFFAIVVLIAAFNLARGTWIQISFVAVGMAAAVTAIQWLRPQSRTPIARVMLLALVCAWSVSLSIGYNTPVLASGVLIVLLIMLSAGYVQRPAVQPFHFALGIASVLITLSFVFNRENHIYKEQPAHALTYALGDVLRGGSGIRTNGNTYALLRDLRNVTDQVRHSGKQFILLPDLAAYWITSEQLNPLPIDWVQGIELKHPALMKRVIDNLYAHSDRQVVILEKFDPAVLAYEKVPLDDPGFYAIVDYVHAHSVMLSETDFFELREMRSAGS